MVLGGSRVTVLLLVLFATRSATRRDAWTHTGPGVSSRGPAIAPLRFPLRSIKAMLCPAIEASIATVATVSPAWVLRRFAMPTKLMVTEALNTRSLTVPIGHFRAWLRFGCGLRVALPGRVMTES